MPLYEYRCVRCKCVTAYMRSSDERNDPAVCSECGGPARRIISVPQDHKRVWQQPREPNELLHTKEIWE